jgi:multidrug transporter EmrE-like cation transporter
MKLSEPKLRWIIFGLCAAAAIRVFVFAAAFPFFNNVDEQAHVDLVVKYSHAKPPRGIEPFASEAALYFAVYSTPEYFVKPEQYGGQYPPPNWLVSPEDRQKILDDEIPFWESRANHESGEPPLYYALAGGWMNFGRVLGLRGLSLLYWVRFLNIGLASALVWIGFAAARSTFPDNHFLQIGVATLLAVWPQSAFYSVQADALSPLCFGIAFLGLAKILQRDRVGIAVPIWTGVAIAATCLVKTSNLPLPLIATIAIALKTFLSAKKGTLHSALITFGVFILSVAVPLGIWFAWNHQHFGDLTATQSKIELLGWTRKPFSQWWSHPIFSIDGIKEFWPGLIASFWRGEFVWGLQRMASAAADAFYAISSAIVILATGALLLRRRSKANDQRFVLWMALLSFVSLVAFLVVLSISFDFGRCPYPSREHPYFTSGRLLNAAAVPFFLLFVYAIDQLGSWTKREWVRWTLLGATALVLIVSQLQVNAPAFSSRYNFFHRKTL